jgi:hypothetical protein
MKSILNSILFALLISFLPQALTAQEKTQAYYNRHENEILPDAQAAFKNGNYERTVELCKWHYIIVGDRSAQSLREKAERCAQLSKEMTENQVAGKIKDAKEIAAVILSLNPDDRAAKEILELVETPVPEPAPIVVPADTVTIVETTIDIPIQEEEPPVEESKPEEIPAKEPQWVTLEPQLPAPSKPSNPVDPRTRFVIKAGATVLNLKQFTQTISPGGSLGIYDIAGSRIGLEAGGYFCPGLSSSSASLFGLDASLVVRLSESVYPKAGVGFFSCTSTDGTGSQTKGLCGGFALNFLLGGHFCLEIGAKYYPAVRLSGLEKVSTLGVSYDFPISREILPGGICPEVSIGWAF